MNNIKNIILSHKKETFLSLFVLIILLISSASKIKEKSVSIFYKEEGVDFKNGRIVERSRNLGRAIEKKLQKRVVAIESSLKKIQNSLDTIRKMKRKEEEKLKKEVTENEIKEQSEKKEVPKSVRFYPSQSYEASYATPSTNYKKNIRPRKMAIKKIRRNRDTISFPIKVAKLKKVKNITIPAGSYVRATLLSGVEAPEGKVLPVLIQADYAFVGPNKTKIDLSGCFILGKSSGNLSIERVEVQVTSLSCVSKNGRSFERDISGFVTDKEDNSFALLGVVNDQQSKVARFAFLSAIVEGIASAVKDSQTNLPSQNKGGGSLISGDKSKYVMASGAASAASKITDWYLKKADGLAPTIGVGSGKEAFIVLQKGVLLPTWFFKSTNKIKKRRYPLLDSRKR